MKHDENKCLRSFSRIGKVDYSSRTLKASKSATIGIHLWGKIDFLTKYCGWHFVWNNSAGIGVDFNDNKTSARDAKKAKKEHQLTDKTKKSSKKK